MRIAGIVTEYNPFHSGHAYQIELLRQRGFDAVVCVCSPGVVQRGETALFPIDVRVRAALSGGADLLLCLPAPYALLSAEGFAQAGVGLLNALGVCEAIAFGAETPDAALLLRTALLLRSEVFSEELKKSVNTGTAFAAVRAAVADSLMPGVGALLATPNNILAVEYCKALCALGEEGAHTVPVPLPLPRRGAQHDAPLTGKQEKAVGFASATALRTSFLSGGVEALRGYVPEACLPVYEQAVREGAVADRRAFGVAVLSRLRAQTAKNGAFAQIRGVSEGLENRLVTCIQSAATLEQLWDGLKTKRYAHARLRRLVLDAALGYTTQLPATPPYLHVLGATQTGLTVLRQAGEGCTLPISTSLAKLAAQNEACRAVAQAHGAAEDLAALCLEQPRPQGTAYTLKFING